MGSAPSMIDPAARSLLSARPPRRRGPRRRDWSFVVAPDRPQSPRRVGGPSSTPQKQRIWIEVDLNVLGEDAAARSLRHRVVLVVSGGMPSCPHCQQIVVTRDGHDRHGRQRFTCTDCGRDFTIRSASAFSGYRWPADVILMAVRWYLRHPLSATSVMELLAERGIDVSNRTVLRWVQAFGPQLAEEARKHRRPLGRTWYTDEMFFFRGQDKWYLYRAVDEHGQVVDVLLREHRDTASAEAFFAQALGRSGQAPI